MTEVTMIRLRRREYADQIREADLVGGARNSSAPRCSGCLLKLIAVFALIRVIHLAPFLCPEFPLVVQLGCSYRIRQLPAQPPECPWPRSSSGLLNGTKTYIFRMQLDIRTLGMIDVLQRDLHFHRSHRESF